MNSFISHFKPWILAIIVLGIVEGIFYLEFHPPRLTWNSFLRLNFAQDESVQRLIAHHKICSLGKEKAEIIQVGDSSGLHGVMPKVVMATLPGYRYLNLSVATNVGYPGYLNIAQIALKQNPGTTHLVLYTSLIGAVPRKMLWDDTHALMSEGIYQEFLNPIRHLIQFPTLKARSSIVGITYYVNYWMRTQEGLYTNNRGYQAFNSIYESSLGWVRETDVEGDIRTDIFNGVRIDPKWYPGEPVELRMRRRAPGGTTDEHFFDWWTLSERSYFDIVYDAFADLAQAHGVKLVLIFNPMPEGIKHPQYDHVVDWGAIEAGLDRLKKRRPETIITGFDFWPNDMFSVFSHVSTPAAVRSSQRVADLLSSIVPIKPSSDNQANPGEATNPTTGTNIDFDKPHSGYGFADDKGKTNVFPMRYMQGTEAFIFANVQHSTSILKLQVVLDQSKNLDSALLLEAECNGFNLPIIQRDHERRIIEWELTPTATRKYLGWLVLRFHRADASLPLAFSHLKITQ